MGQAAKIPTFTAEDYLAWEPLQVDRHEYLDVKVFAALPIVTAKAKTVCGCYTPLVRVKRYSLPA